MVRNILKENSSYTNDSWEKLPLSLTIRNISALGNCLLRLPETEIEGIFARPTERASAAQDFFLGGSGHKAGAHTRLAFLKNNYGFVDIPLIRSTSYAMQ